MNYKHFKPVSQYTDAERLRTDIDFLTDSKVENHRRGYRWNYQTAMLTGARRKLDAMKRRLAVLEAKVEPREARAAVKSYNITCCECGHHAGRTECEVTATSPTMCETCHDELLEEVETSNLPPAGTHGDW